MTKLTGFFKQLRLRQILTVFLATVVLFVGTACNSGDVRGARPDNPAVQAGGSNNPYKMGGDTNTNYNLSPDPKVSRDSAKSKGNRADLQILSNQLIASATEGGKLNYPANRELQGEPADVGTSLPIIDMQDFETAEPGGQIQRQEDIGDRVEDRLSAVKQAFDKAGDFITDNAEEALERHETTANPNNSR